MMAGSTNRRRAVMIAVEVVQGIAFGLLLALALLVLASTPPDVPLFRYQQF